MSLEIEITWIEDERLARIDPSFDHFYNNVQNYPNSENNENIATFQKICKDVRASRLLPFYKPIMDPSVQYGKIVFIKGKEPAVSHSFSWWEHIVSEMPKVSDYHWKIGTERQYFAFLIYLVNRIVEQGLPIDVAMHAICCDSKTLGHYRNSNDSKLGFEETGSREFLGFCDLANTFKMLSSSNDVTNSFWHAAGNYNCYSNKSPLIDIRENYDKVIGNANSVAWLVLSKD